MAQHGAHKKAMPKPGTHRMPGGRIMSNAAMKKRMAARPKKGKRAS